MTQAQYRRATGHNPSAEQGNDDATHEGNLPVESVSWYDAMRFCEALTEREREAGRLPDGHVYRLPTEAEWEYAARGGHLGGDYRYAGSDDIDAVAVYATTDSLQPVATLQPNRLGLHDMSGNVWEWVYDGYLERYEAQNDSDPVIPPDASFLRIRRGGSHMSDPDHCRVWYRNAASPRMRHPHTGFRVVLGPELQ